MSLDARKAQDLIRALKDKAKTESGAELRQFTADVTRLGMREWLRRFGDLDATPTDAAALSAFVRTIKAQLGKAPVDIGPTIRKAVKDAQRIALDHATAMVGDDVTVRLAISSEVRQGIDAGEGKATSRLGLASDALEDLGEDSTFADVTTGALSFLAQAVTALENVATWFVASEANQTTADVAQAAGVGVVVVGERDACLQCDDYIGLTNTDDGYDDPPYHPNCVCTLQPWDPNSADPTEVSYPEALRREADRSIAKGFSAWDSNTAKAKAAGQILKTPAGRSLPKSVQQVARKAAAKGGFDRTYPYAK